MLFRQALSRFHRSPDKQTGREQAFDEAPANGASIPIPPSGIAVLEVDRLLKRNAGLIARIKLCYGCEPPAFESEILAPARRYAAFVNTLPATPDNHFSEPGGLLRLGLEIAFQALQETDAQLFAGRATISERRRLEPRWRLATFIAGMCCELHRTLNALAVTDPSGCR